MFVEARDPSTLARHTSCAPFACVGPLLLRIEQAFRPEYECMVVERCMACGRRVMAWGVLPGEPVYGPLDYGPLDYGARGDDDEEDGA